MAVSQEELILRMMPLTPEARKWYLGQPDLAAALKFLNADRFIALGAVSITSSPLKPDDEVIGFFVLDYKQKKWKVKQDFIVNLARLNKEYVLYTSLPVPKYGRHVKHINEFIADYGGNGLYYKGAHHPPTKSLDPAIVARIPRAIKIAQKRIAHGRPVVKAQAELDEIDVKLREIGQ
jgi:hypothetical protein